MKKYQIGLTEKKIIKDQSLLRHEDIKNRIQVLPELEVFIPPLAPEEFSQLEANILKEGCREALLVWETTEELAGLTGGSEAAYVLIDGHNRYQICRTHQIDFKIHLVQFSTKEAVFSFMIENQLGRRNLTPEQASYLRGLRYRTEKLERGKYDRSSYKGHSDLYESDEDKGQNVPYEKGTTSERLAERFNVSEKTIKRDADFSEGLDKLSPELKKDVLGGRIKVNKNDIQQLAALPVSALTSIAEINEALGKPKAKETTQVSEGDIRNELKKKLTQLTKTEEYDEELLNSIVKLVKQWKTLK